MNSDGTYNLDLNLDGQSYQVKPHSGGWLIVSVFFHLSIVLYVMDVYQFVAVWLIWWNEPAPS